MEKLVLSPYAVPFQTPVRESNSILYAASSVPGSATLKYIPMHPTLHKYGIKKDCGKYFHIPIVWKSEEKNTDIYKSIFHKLIALPLLSGSSVVYMQQSQGYFFDLKLEGNVRITITQYVDESEKGAYINVVLAGEVLVQDFMMIDDIVSAMKEFYEGGKY